MKKRWLRIVGILAIAGMCIGSMIVISFKIESNATAFASKIFDTMVNTMVDSIESFRRCVPSSDPNEQWVSQDPDIVLSFYYDAETFPSGHIIINGRVIKISPSIVFGNRYELCIYAWPFINPDSRSDADILVIGDCDYHEDWFSMEVTFDRDGLFEGIDTIIFRKEYIDASQPSDATEELRLLNKSICALGGPDGLAVFDLQDRKALALSG